VIHSIHLAFALTIGVETLVATLILRRFVWAEAAVVQCVTWPYAQILMWRTGKFWLIECGVVLIEIALWRALATSTWRRAAVVSILANGVTAAIAFLGVKYAP
jgi:hypothetical protein